MESVRLGFFKLTFHSFFRWWWAVTTGFASIAGLFLLSEEITLCKFQVVLLIFLVSALLFLAVSAIYQGSRIYKGSLRKLRVADYKKRPSDQKLCFLMDCNFSIPQDTLVEVQKFDEVDDVLVAALKIGQKNSQGKYVTDTIWISPGHQRDLATGVFSCSELKAETLIKLETIRKLREKQ